jgi:hypothetical protein
LFRLDNGERVTSVFPVLETEEIESDGGSSPLAGDGTPLNDPAEDGPGDTDDV